VKRSTTTPNRRWMLWPLIGVAVALLAGHVAPPLIINLMKLQDTNVSSTYRTAPAEAQLLDVAAFRDASPTPGNADREECTDEETAPVGCFRITGPAQVERTTATAPAKDYIEADVTTHISVDVAGDTALEIEDELRISRDSTFPVPEPHAHTHITFPTLQIDAAGEPEVREGLQWFFPFTTERRSYLYFDVLAQAPTPIDYVGETEVSGLEAWEFAQTLEGTALSWPSDEAFFGPAERFYSPAERAERGFEDDTAVALDPYYAVGRTVVVEPETGTVLDVQETWHAYLATDDEDAADLLAAADGAAHPLRTLLYTDADWDAGTREQQADQARPDLAVLRGLQILAWVANAVAVALIALLVVHIVRVRDRRARTLTAPAEL
jgi:hypothetical protein